MAVEGCARGKGMEEMGCAQAAANELAVAGGSAGEAAGGLAQRTIEYLYRSAAKDLPVAGNCLRLLVLVLVLMALRPSLRCGRPSLGTQCWGE